MSNNIEIKQVSEVETWIGENRIVLLTNLNIIHVIAVGEQTEEIAKLQKELNSKLFGLFKGKINFLIDLNRCGKNSPEARKTWNELSENEKTNKVAIYGLHPVSRVIASFVIGVSKSNNQRFFKTKDEAIAWIVEDEVTDNQNNY